MKDYAVFVFFIVATIAVIIHLILRVIQERRTKKMMEDNKCLTNYDSKEMLEESKKQMKLNQKNMENELDHRAKVESILERIAKALEDNNNS